MEKKDKQEISVIDIHETINQKKEKERRQREQKKRQIKKRITNVVLSVVALGLGATGAIHGINMILEERQNREDNIKAQEEEEKVRKINSLEQEAETEPEVEEEKEELTAETKNNLCAFLKDEYIENYERMTGDTELKTDDITMRVSYENYILIDNKTGEMFAHGEEPKVVIQKLETSGIEYVTEDNVRVYKVCRVIDGEEKTIDCVSVIDGESKGIILPSQYDEPYQSVLQEMGNLIPDGLDCIDAMEQGKEKDIMMTKATFMKTLEKYKAKEENKTNNLQVEKINQTESEMEDDLEL